MSLNFNSEQQRIEGSGVVNTGAWINATYFRQLTTVNVISPSHGLDSNDSLYLDFTSGGATDGVYTITVVDDDNFTITDSASGTIVAGNTVSYRRRRSVTLQGDNNVSVAVGVGANQKEAIFVNKNASQNVRVGVNTANPEFELDVEGQIRTTRSIISDTAQILNLDIDTIVNPALNLRAPNLVNFEDTDVNSPTFGTTFFPTADTPELSDQSRRIATTDFVYKVATNDTGGRVYVSSTIGSDTNDGRSAARPVATIKKAAQIAYGLQKATPDPTDEYVSIIVSGGEYLEDNPISLPRNCSLIGDNLRRVVVRPINADRHMVKASNETYVNGVVFRDALQNASDPQSEVIHTWNFAFVFDDKQRLYYEPEVRQIPAVPGDQFRGENIFKVTFTNHTGTTSTPGVGFYVQGGSSGTQGRVQSVTFTGTGATQAATGFATILVTSGPTATFNQAESIFYDSASFANIITDINNPGVSLRFEVADTESLRPELETISNQIFQHTVDSERETLQFIPDSTNIPDLLTDRITISGHRLATGSAVFYNRDGNPVIPGLIDNTVYYVRSIDSNTIELYDTWENSTTITEVEGRKDITGNSTGYHYLTSGNIMPENNQIFIERHGLVSGDPLEYRSSSLGDIGGLSNDTRYYAYKYNDNWIALAASAADATNKNASGIDDPVLIDITSAGKGDHRFDLSNNLVSVATIDCSLTTQQAYNGVLVTSTGTNFHTFEVGQEVNLYGFTSSTIDFGGAASYAYSQTGNAIQVTITSTDASLVGTIWGNLTSLGEAGLKFNFTSGTAVSKTYHIDSFGTGSSHPSLPANTALGVGFGVYDVGTNTIRFTLKAPDSKSTTGSLTISDNIADLNGRKYVTHRIERPDGYSLQFAVRGNYSVFNASLDPTGDQTVISASNYVLASLRNSPYVFTKSEPVSDRFRDGAEAIKANQNHIAEEAYAFVKSHHTSSVTRGTQPVIDSVNYSTILGNTRAGTYSVSGATCTVTVPLGHAGYALQTYNFTFSGALGTASLQVADQTDHRTFTITLPNSSNDGETGTVTYLTPLPHITPGSLPYADRYADASSLILANADMIAEMAVERMIAEQSFTVPTGTQNCKDDVVDFLKSLTYNLTYGGNDQVYDAAKYYVDGAHVAGEEDESVIAFNYSRDLAIAAMRNETFTSAFTTYNLGGYTQVKDTTITQDIQSPACQDVASTITTLFGVLTTAIGSTGNPGNLSGVTRTYAEGDQQCVDDIIKILKAFQFDLRYNGNSKIVEAANLYINSGAIQFIANEVDFSRTVYAKAKELAVKAIRNDLATGSFSQITPVANGSVTVDSVQPECANVVAALTTNWQILDTTLSTSTAYSGTVTNPDPLITELGSGGYSFPLLSDNLDLPVIEASPYIQNSSLISFLGGSGCEIDGAKVATPNVPRPGLKVDGQGNITAKFDPQGKSMVASAFTIISFGGTAYNITNDGYTQLVSVFAIFCQDGIVCQSGGYASVTNSASNFGTFALRATGFRAEPYAFDIGTVQSVTNEVDGNGVATGRQTLRIGGTTLTNIPIEDYIVKFDGLTNTNTAIEFIVLETELISGSPGTQIVADITINQSLDLTETSTSTVYSYANGNLSSGLVNRTIKLHRPSVVNSSSHTWEYSGSGNTYAALPQNGGVGLGTAYEAAEQSFGQVYTSGTNEFGDFKVGNFVTIFNRTGAISFVGTVSISELSSIKIVGGNITITGFSADDNLGGAFASDSILPTQAAVKDYISNNLGPYLNQPYSTNAVPSALVQLTASGKINIDQIPALRPFNITSVASTAARLAIEDAEAGDIAIETSTETFNVAPGSINTSNDQITITGHGLTTGAALIYTQGTAAIGGLATGNTYYVYVVDANTIQLAVSEANAQVPTAIDLTTQGTGTQVFTTQGTAVSYILENDLESQFLAFQPNSAFTFNNGDIVVGSSTTARGTVTGYNDGRVFKYNISNGGGGYTGDFSLTISTPDDTVNGVQAAATANVSNGVVTAVTITNFGKGYYTQPTVTPQASPTANNAVIAPEIEGRVDIDIANNIKFDAGDFILDQGLVNEGTGTYSQNNSNVVSITETSHGLANADLVYLDFTSGTAPDGFYTINVINVNEYTIQSVNSTTTSGNINRKRIIDLTRVINTSASNAANWTQLTSTNIDASNIVAGTIDPERLAARGAANSNTFLRGDSSYEFVIQSLKPETSDAMLISGSITDSSYIDSITISNGGTGFTDGNYQNLPVEGGSNTGGGSITGSDDNVARANYVVSGGAITSATITDSGTGYAADFTVTIPAELGSGTSAVLTANKGTINRVYGNASIDIRKGNDLTPSATIYGNYGVFKFRKDVANQAIGNQSEGGFIVTANGEVSIDQGPGSKLNADFLHGNPASYFEDATNLLSGTLDPARLANTTYNISISGTADTANRVFNDVTALSSNPTPSTSGAGISAALRNNAATGLNDGGSTHGVLTYRREATGNAATQLGFTSNNNLYIRGNSGAGNVYGNWAKMWSSANDGPNLNDPSQPARTGGLNADKLDNYEGLWYQSGYNLGDTRGVGVIGDPFLPEVLGREKIFLENLYVHDTGNKYTLYIPKYHVNSGTNGNINNGGTYTIYSDSNATNNIGSIVVDANGVSEQTGPTGDIYSLVTGSITFVGVNTNANIAIFGPNPGTKWTVTSSNEISSGSSQIFGLTDNPIGAKLQIGKGNVTTTPSIDFRSSGLAANYDVQFFISGGNATNGQGTLRINAADFTFNGNTIWHAGNDGASSQLDAHYVDGYTQNSSNVNNTLVRRTGSGDINISDLYADQGIFSNNGTGALSIGDGNGITFGKVTTNTAALKGKGDGNQGFIRFGNDSNSLGWNGTYLSYNNVYFRNGRIGIGDSNPGSPLEIVRQGSGSQLFADFRDGRSGYHRITFGGDGSSPFMTFSDTDNDSGWQLGADDNDQSWFVVKGFTTASGALNTTFQGARNSASLCIYSATNRVFMNKGSGVSTGSGSTLTVGGAIETDNRLISTVATGTSPLAVTSTTVCTNLNADLLDGYQALGLPYFGSTVNVWLNDAGGQPRFYFGNNSHTYFRTGDNFYWRSDNDTSMGSVDGNGGTWTFYSGGDQNQTNYRVEVRGQNGLNINTSSVGLSSGQRSVVLRAEGDKQWIDTYGVFKRNRQTIGENITVSSSDNCMTAGPITINNGNTITIANGGSWSII